MKESRVRYCGANSTLWKEAYGRNFSQHCNSTTWTLYVGAHSTVYNGEGLEFKGVFTSIVPDLCENFLSGSTVRKMVRKVGFLRLFGLAM